jgi:hypothetical protein
MKNEIINEALSKAYRLSISKIEKTLVNKFNLLLSEARYLTSFYTAVKEANLFKSNYFKNFEYEGDMIDFNNIQKFAKEVDTFYDVVSYVLHSKEFLAVYDIFYNGNEVTIEKKKIEDEEEEKTSTFTTPFDEYKVAEDDNYITFHLPTYPVAQKLREYYFKVFPDDPLVSSERNFFVPTYCIMGSSASTYFRSQKHSTEEDWYFTLLKVAPTYFINKVVMPKLLGKETNFKTINELRNSVSTLIYNQAKMSLGEVYLTKKHDSPEKNNHGHHNFTNPGHGAYVSKLAIEKQYDYATLSKGNANPFTIEGNALLSYNASDLIVTIPNGVTTIESEAFKGKRINILILPYSLVEIKQNAFKDSRVEIIVASNNLEYISKRAFDSSSKIDQLGTVTPTGDKYIVSKPARLSYYPKDIEEKMNKLADLYPFPEDMEEYKSKFKNLAESLKLRFTKQIKNDIIISEAFKVKKPTYYEDESGEIFIEGGLAFFTDYAIENTRELIVPEGAYKFGESLGKLQKLVKVVLPSTFKDISNSPFSNSRCQLHVKYIDMYNTQIKEIPEGTFRDFQYLRTLILPKDLEVIGTHALRGIGVDTININSQIKSLPSDLITAIPFLTTIETDNKEALMNNPELQKHIRHIKNYKINIIEKEH